MPAAAALAARTAARTSRSPAAAAAERANRRQGPNRPGTALARGGKDADGGKGRGRHTARMAPGQRQGSLATAGQSPPGTAAAKPAGDAPDPAQPKTQEERGRLWVKDGDFVRPVDVRIGASDGVNTEVSGRNVEARAGSGHRRMTAAEQDSERHQSLCSQAVQGRRKK